MAADSRFDTSYVVAANSSNSSLFRRERLIMMSVVMTNTVSNNTVNLHALYVRVSGFTGGTVDCGLPASAPLMEVRPPQIPQKLNGQVNFTATPPERSGTELHLSHTMCVSPPTFVPSHVSRA